MQDCLARITGEKTEPLSTIDKRLPASVLCRSDVPAAESAAIQGKVGVIAPLPLQLLPESRAEALQEVPLEHDHSQLVLYAAEMALVALTSCSQPLQLEPEHRSSRLLPQASEPCSAERPVSCQQPVPD